MDGEPTAGPRSLPLTLAGQVDAACDRFEAGWKAGQPGPARTKLLIR